MVMKKTMIKIENQIKIVKPQNPKTKLNTEGEVK